MVHLDCLRDATDQSEKAEGLATSHLKEEVGLACIEFFGHFSRVPTYDDIASAVGGSDEGGVLVIELPQRMNGGGVISLADLRRVRELCVAKGVSMHMDGARLFEVQPYYGIPLAEICSLFDTVYVSFYKGLGALSGAVLNGNSATIASAKSSMKLRGGNLFTRSPYTLHCREQLAACLPSFEGRFTRMQRMVEVVKTVLAEKQKEHLVRFDPPSPQSCMVHVYVRCAGEGTDLAADSHQHLEAARAAAAEDTGISVWNALRGGGHAEYHGKSAGATAAEAEHASWGYFEWSMGPHNMELTDEQVGLY
jgi:threonine aldolase